MAGDSEIRNDSRSPQSRPVFNCLRRLQEKGHKELRRFYGSFWFSSSLSPQMDSWLRKTRPATSDPRKENIPDLRDYSAEVTVHFEIETFKAPDMQAKLYCKVPDKMKVDSKRVFSFPKRVDTLIPLCSRKRTSSQPSRALLLMAKKP